jgi:hypothetical protein
MQCIYILDQDKIEIDIDIEKYLTNPTEIRLVYNFRKWPSVLLSLSDYWTISNYADFWFVLDSQLSFTYACLLKINIPPVDMSFQPDVLSWLPV